MMSALMFALIALLDENKDAQKEEEKKTENKDGKKEEKKDDKDRHNRSNDRRSDRPRRDDKGLCFASVHNVLLQAVFSCLLLYHTC